MKRKFLLSAFLFVSTLRGYAQDARGAMNQILDGYTLPIFAACMIVGLALGVAQQLDNIIDKENRGTRRDGLFALGWYVGRGRTDPRHDYQRHTRRGRLHSHYCSQR